MRGRSLAVAYVATATVFSAQLVLAPVLPSLTRTLLLTEFQAGLFVTVSSAALMVVSPLWGRVVTRFGARRVATLSMVGIAVCQLAFAGLAQVALADGRSAATFPLLLACRALGQGVAAAATSVAVISYLSQNTAAGAERVRALGMFGAALGLGTVLGPALGSFLASQSLLWALYVPALPVAVVAVVVWRWLGDGHGVASAGERGALRAVQVWPYLALGVVLFTVLAPVPLLLGFLVQDRFHLSAEAGASGAGLALVAYGLVSLVVQAFVVRWLAWPPMRLVRVGVPISLVAFVGIAVAPNLAVVVLATGLFGLGHGLAIPGYTAAPTFAVASDQQGRLAGFLTSANGAGSILGPLLATPLYGISPAVPLLANAALMALLLVFVGLSSGNWQRSHTG
ncbi:MFS transporter [Tenggerimyces flavus]|uniref:MFS transporter n=1 Tax=Tenggerimyces flavus TaxID=1708749 RepID=A0ABV7YE67_9ACTN|nr:MFS transporter [Tenggerimyces flavus]MBM7784264.1 MFS family permease [Tenggerimyces flavus]